jgi:hypothetical protein
MVTITYLHIYIESVLDQKLFLKLVIGTFYSVVDIKRDVVGMFVVCFYIDL